MPVDGQLDPNADALAAEGERILGDRVGPGPKGGTLPGRGDRDINPDKVIGGVREDEVLESARTIGELLRVPADEVIAGARSLADLKSGPREYHDDGAQPSHAPGTCDRCDAHRYRERLAALADNRIVEVPLGDLMLGTVQAMVALGFWGDNVPDVIATLIGNGVVGACETFEVLRPRSERSRIMRGM